jgi:predicted methyltransferase
MTIVLRSSPSRPAGAAAAVLIVLTGGLIACGTTSPGAGAVTDVAGSAMAPATLPAALNAAQIASLLASPDRSAADRVNDQRRHPAEMLAFIGLRPGMQVLDLSAGGGYTTELLARAVGPAGRVYGQSAPRTNRPPPPAAEGAATPPPPAVAASAGPPRPSPVALAARVAQSGLSWIVAVVQPFEAPVPAELAPAGLDLATLMFNYHDLGHLGVDRARMNAAVFAALKPGGLYVIADHSGRTGTGISESGTLHRIEESFLRAEVELAGFRLLAQGNFLRNPADPRDRNTPEPPMPKDEFVLKFVKP